MRNVCCKQLDCIDFLIFVCFLHVCTDLCFSRDIIQSVFKSASWYASLFSVTLKIYETACHCV